MTQSKTDSLPLLLRPLKPGQLPPVGLTLPVNPPASDAKTEAKAPAQESGGPEGAEPTRFGDWERKGRCSDF